MTRTESSPCVKQFPQSREKSRERSNDFPNVPSFLDKRNRDRSNAWCRGFQRKRDIYLKNEKTFSFLKEEKILVSLDVHKEICLNNSDEEREGGKKGLKAIIQRREQRLPTFRARTRCEGAVCGKRVKRMNKFLAKRGREEGAASTFHSDLVGLASFSRMCLQLYRMTLAGMEFHLTSRREGDRSSKRYHRCFHPAVENVAYHQAARVHSLSLSLRVSLCGCTL